MSRAYDDQNIFARILRGEIPNDTVAESEASLAFRDISPRAPVHVLVIPKGAYIDHAHFCAEASDAEIADFARLTAKVIAEAGLRAEDGSEGYRVISNSGPHGNQEVPHYHVHVVGGAPLGAMVSR